jgi:hypothetical protein
LNLLNDNKALFFSFSATIYLIILLYLNACPPDIGDGLSHYFVAQGAWQNTELFLHHWGKPFFTFFTSFFAQFGFKTYILFNIICFFIFCVLAQKIMKIYRVSDISQSFFPILLLTVPDVQTTILGGLTEPFFGLISVLGLYLLVKERFLLFAIIISFIPFARSEGQFVVVLAFMILVLKKQLKIIPFLSFGFLVYAIIGFFVLDDFFWYFNNDPYTGELAYGSGDWLNYWENKDFHLGNILFWVGLLGLLSILFFIKNRKINKDEFILIFYSLSIYFVIIFVHAYLWRYGLKGSFGLSRIATHGLPLLVLVSLIYIDKIVNNYELPSFFSKAPSFSLIALSVFIVLKSEYPTQLEYSNLQVVKASEYLKTIKDKVGKIHYFHPLFAYHNHLNPFIKDDKYLMTYFENFENALKKLNDKDIIVRDSHFGPVDMKLTLEKIKSEKRFVPIKTFYSNKIQDDFEGLRWRVEVYQFQENRDTSIIDTICYDLKINEHSKKIEKEVIYTDFVRDSIRWEEGIDKSWLLVEGNLKNDLSNLVYLEISDEPLKNRRSFELSLSKDFYFKNELYFEPGFLKVFIFNPNQCSGEIEINSVKLCYTKEKNQLQETRKFQ